MDPSQLVFATVIVLGTVQFGAQAACYMRLLAKRTAYKTMTLSWLTCLIAAGSVQLWPGVGICSMLAAVSAIMWWRHRNDDDDDAGRRRRRVSSTVRSKLPRPVAIARPTPTEP